MKKTLLLCQDNIGDLVFTSALTSHLSSHGEKITLVTRIDTEAVAPFIPGIQSHHSIPLLDKIDPIFHWKKHVAFWQFIKWLKRQNFDIAITVSKNWRLGLALYLAKIPVTIGWDFPKLAPFLTHATPRPSLKKPAIEAIQSLISHLHYPPQESPHYSLDLDAVQSKKQLMNITKDTNDQWVGLHAFASLKNRCVDLETWLKVAREIKATGFTPVWFGTTSELNTLRDIRGCIGLFSDYLCNGQLDQVIPLLSYCDAYIGHDSGVLHLASAIGIPNLGIFTPGEPKRTFPQGIYQGTIIFRPSPEQLSSTDIMSSFKKHLEPLLN
ncbi:Heptosyltransferase superfamily [gamma proteobacterium HTCC5015]|nr:Heptosyltransferase superfamily [gamma proteobacterium HTCC5015]